MVNRVLNERLKWTTKLKHASWILEKIIIIAGIIKKQKRLKKKNKQKTGISHLYQDLNFSAFCPLLFGGRFTATRRSKQEEGQL